MEPSTLNIDAETIDKMVDVILRQTNYTKEEAMCKLKESNYDCLLVIRTYFGISDKPKTNKVSSINQEIYKQLRYNLDSSMRDYKNRVQEGSARNLL
uniref:Uncharacterized protein n=1 Tax=viral metagenome TaxID=1070528 RepID=A0A6C0ES11_9ZZZZ